VGAAIAVTGSGLKNPHPWQVLPACARIELGDFSAQLLKKDNMSAEIPRFRSLGWSLCGNAKPPCASDYSSGL
jgi:hypothetical protein